MSVRIVKVTLSPKELWIAYVGPRKNPKASGIGRSPTVAYESLLVEMVRQLMVETAQKSLESHAGEKGEDQPPFQGHVIPMGES